MNGRQKGRILRRSWPEPGSFPLHPAKEDLIVDAVVEDDRAYINGFAGLLPRVGRDLGVPPCRMRIEAAAIILMRSADHLAALEVLLQEMSTPTSPLNSSLFTTEDFATFLGLTQKDIDKIVSWMKSHELDAIKTSPARTSITFSGTLLAMEAAFRTEFRCYRLKDRSYLANAFELSVPAAFAGVIGGFCTLGGFVSEPQTRALLLPH